MLKGGSGLMPHSSRVCVILVNYFGAADTRECIQSLENSSVPMQVVVVDNSPNDPELEKVLQDYPAVHLINAPENLGFGRGNNLGIDWAIKNTDCEFIFIFNNDAMVQTNTIEYLLKAMKEHPEAAIISPRIVFAEEPDKLWYGGGEVDWRRGGGKVPGVLGSANAHLAMTARHVTFATGCAMFFRRAVLERQKGFDDRFFMYEEDLELSLRVQESGWKIWYEPMALVYHVGQGSIRGQGEKFTGLLWPSNPNLPFYVSNIICNRMLNMNMYARGRNKVLYLMFFPLLILKLSWLYLINARTDGLKAMLNAFLQYRKYLRG